MQIKNNLINFLKVLIWPILFELGQFFIILIFTFLFNNQYIKTLEQTYPNLSNKEIETKLVESINTPDYQNSLSNYLDQHMLLMITISFIILVPIFFIIFKKINQDKKLKISLKEIIMIIITSILLAVSLNYIIYLLNNIFHFTNRYDDTKFVLTLFFSVGILGPIIEELVFRGIVYNKLKIFNSKTNAMIITTIIFALIHAELSQLFYTFIIGTFLIKLYDKYENIKIPILAHILINSSTFLFVSFIL